ncbi:putative integral membrane protein [Ilyonectria robusta]
MANTFQKIDRSLEHLTTTGWLKPKNLHYACASSGLICGTLFFLAFIASDFLPPPRPWWTPERTAEHYASHQKGVHAGSVLLMFSGTFFLPYTAIISDQMRRIPNIPWVLPQLQLASGIASTIGFFMPGMQLAATALRKDRDPKLIELSSDMFWMFAVMPFQTFILMSWAWSYAIIIDNRPKPLYPKAMALVNLVSPAMFLWSVAIHTTLHGPFAWNGALGFWLPLVAFGLQFLGDTYFLFRAIHRDDLENDRVDSPITECSETT